MSAERYLALGDSYTIGTGASDPSRSWAWIIASRLGAELINPSVNGFTTLDLITYELPLVQRLKPEYVTVLIGVNDLVQGRSAADYRQSLKTIYDEVARLGHERNAAVSIPDWYYVPAAVEFGGSDRVATLTKAFNDVAREEAGKRGFTWIDITRISRSGIGSSGWIASDELHPGDDQYSAWAEEIWRAIGSPSGWR